MSAFVGQTASVFGGQLVSPDYQNRNVMLANYRYGWGAPPAERPWEDGQLWPHSRFAGQPADMSLYVNGVHGGLWEAPRDDATGGQQHKKLIGTTLDSAGANLGSCIVQGFTTSDDAFQGQMTSDTGGYYVLPTFRTGAHYIVAYKAGSPDVAGTTVNTLTPV